MENKLQQLYDNPKSIFNNTEPFEFILRDNSGELGKATFKYDEFLGWQMTSLSGCKNEYTIAGATQKKWEQVKRTCKNLKMPTIYAVDCRFIAGLKIINRLLMQPLSEEVKRDEELILDIGAYALCGGEEKEARELETRLEILCEREYFDLYFPIL